MGRFSPIDSVGLVLAEREQRVVALFGIQTYIEETCEALQKELLRTGMKLDQAQKIKTSARQTMRALVLAPLS
jgi:hypothetical protein